MVSNVISEIAEKDKIGHYNMRFIKPLDKKQLVKIFNSYEYILTIEDGCKIGGFGSAILEFANEIESQIPISILGIEDVFIEHGTTEELHIISKIDHLSLKSKINNLINAF